MKIKENVFERLKKLTKKPFDESSDIYSIGIDSLDLVEMVTQAEEDLSIIISDDALERMKTVGDVVKEFEKASK